MISIEIHLIKWLLQYHNYCVNFTVQLWKRLYKFHYLNNGDYKLLRYNWQWLKEKEKKKRYFYKHIKVTGCKVANVILPIIYRSCGWAYSTRMWNVCCYPTLSREIRLGFTFVIHTARRSYSVEHSTSTLGFPLHTLRARKRGKNMGRGRPDTGWLVLRTTTIRWPLTIILNREFMHVWHFWRSSFSYPWFLLVVVPIVVVVVVIIVTITIVVVVVVVFVVVVAVVVIVVMTNDCWETNFQRSRL